MNESSPAKKPRKLPRPWLYALPQGQLPKSVKCAGVRYAHAHTFKHDFFAATGRYESDSQSAVLKVGRITDFFGLPLDWIGRFLRDRESRLYEMVEDLPGVPSFIGRVGATGFLHDFVPGHPLGRDEAVSDTFFDELSGLLSTLHGRDIAYVDLNKRQNILMGDDGKPYLIDFQISLHLPGNGWGRVPGARWLLTRFQRADEYHLLKHKRRLRPDLMTAAETARVTHVSFWIRLHRLVARPFTYLRRRTLERIRKSETVHVAGSDAK